MEMCVHVPEWKGDVAAGVSAAFAVDSYAKIDEIDAQSSRPDFTLLVYDDDDDDNLFYYN